MPTRPISSARRALLGALSVAFTLVGCGSGSGGGAPGPGDPPVPDNLAAFDPEAAARVEQALARVRAEKESAQAWADLGALYLSERLKELAIECTRTAEALEPRQPKWPYRAAILLAQNGALDQACAAMQRALALEPGYAPAHARLGSFRLQLGDLAGAERDFRRATELDARYPGGWLGLARVALQNDQAQAAVAILERLASEDPARQTYRQLLSAARRALDPAAPAAPESLLADDEAEVWSDPWEREMRAFARTPALQEIGLLLESGRGDEALAKLEAERKRGGGDPDEVARLFATAHVLRGDLDSARRELASVFASRPDDVRALMLQAQIQDRSGDSAGAVRSLERVNALQPEHGGAFAAKGDQLVRLGKPEAALAAYQRALELGVRDLRLRSSLGTALMVLKRWPEAIEVFEGILAERPDDGDLWLQVALARLRSGEFEKADEAMQRAQATGKASPKLFENVRKTLEKARTRGKSGDENEPEPGGGR